MLIIRKNKTIIKRERERGVCVCVYGGYRVLRITATAGSDQKPQSGKSSPQNVLLL